ncbi:ubiquitin-specific protease otu1 [Coemansia sp. RSA 451]|nr:ubiquitin-specific protease otu1 [Coemansia sp. RSA 451]KAJ2531970.1 ubiquitin-specific protease otu1 [Coemansia sp. RSA 1937]
MGLQLVLSESKSGQSNRFAYDECITFGQFKQNLAHVTQLPADEIIVKFGHPPVELDYPDHTLLADTPVHSTAEVTVARKPSRVASSLVHAPINQHYHSMDTHETVFPRQMHHTGNVPFHTASVAISTGYLVRRCVPSDNSCLFTSIARCLSQPGLTPRSLRELVAQTIAHSPHIYNEAVLERPVHEYCAWILDDDSWGGGIELAVLSQAFHVEVCSIDVRFQRVDCFGEGRYARRVFLLYTGSHYDYVALAAHPDASPEFDQTEFLTSLADADATLAAAMALAAKL